MSQPHRQGLDGLANYDNPEGSGVVLGQNRPEPVGGEGRGAGEVKLSLVAEGRLGGDTREGRAKEAP